MGVAFAAELLRPHAESRRPRLVELRPMLRVGRQIFVRTTALFASFLIAASVLARMGDAPLGAHQIAFQLWVFLALLLDAVAIAGQVLVGRMLGSGDPEGAHAASVRMIWWSVGLGAAFAVALLPLSGWIPRAFSGDHAVVHQAKLIWPLFALMQPLAGAVFALDGILIGASDTSFLMWSMLAASGLVYVPVALLSLAFGWGIVGVWSGLVGLIAARLTLLGTRFLSRRWAVIGWA
jgi:putative MATE family efflux protein